MNILLSWGAKVSPAFNDAVVKLCHGFRWSSSHPSWLMACMAFESAETFRADIQNAAGSGATGLIQFMPSTAHGLNITIPELGLMTPIAQLEYVRRYFAPYARRINSLADMYMAILLPKYVGQPDSSVLFSGGIAYRQNSGLDNDHDGKITKAEAAALVTAKYIKGLKKANAMEVSW